LPKGGKIKKAIGTGNLFFITKKEFLPNRPEKDMANKLTAPIFFLNACYLLFPPLVIRRSGIPVRIKPLVK
jgi:hypothetical protein